MKTRSRKGLSPALFLDIPWSWEGQVADGAGAPGVQVVLSGGADGGAEAQLEGGGPERVKLGSWGVSAEVGSEPSHRRVFYS